MSDRDFPDVPESPPRLLGNETRPPVVRLFCQKMRQSSEPVTLRATLSFQSHILPWHLHRFHSSIGNHVQEFRGEPHGRRSPPRHCGWPAATAKAGSNACDARHVQPRRQFPPQCPRVAAHLKGPPPLPPLHATPARPTTPPIPARWQIPELG